MPRCRELEYTVTPGPAPPRPAGSSAGAGSEVFHVYKHLRRKEYARQDWIQRQATAEDLNAEFMQQLAEKKAAAEEKTSKKRAKRWVPLAVM